MAPCAAWCGVGAALSARDKTLEVQVVFLPADSLSRYVSSRWAWVLQDALGIAFCLYMLKTVRLPTFKVGRRADTSEPRCFLFLLKGLVVIC